MAEGASYFLRLAAFLAAFFRGFDWALLGALRGGLRLDFAGLSSPRLALRASIRSMICAFGSSSGAATISSPWILRSMRPQTRLRSSSS